MLRKVIPVKHNKIWGYEIWLSSPVKGKETNFENGEKVCEGPLIKIIKANTPLSVQVHPDDLLAKKLENQENGKSESWLVLDASDDAELVLGLKNYDENFIRDEIIKGTFEDNLLKVKVSKNDFFNIPAGLVHGIGGGLLIFEVQQPSDVTYRYYDYNRLENGKLRELHLEKAIKSQKNLSWKINPENNMYDIGFCKQTFLSKPIVLERESIIVDLEEYIAYFAPANEKIDQFNNYVVISID